VRTKHGALLDAELTAQVYLELVGGRQTRLMLAPRDRQTGAQTVEEPRAARVRPHELPQRASGAELEAHTAFVAGELGSDAIWNWR
jgi:DNA polymerase-3 subunit epsilon